MDDKTRTTTDGTINVSGFDRRRFMAGAAGSAIALIGRTP